MIATALQLQEVTKNAVYDEMIQESAGELLVGFGEMGFEEFADALYKYSILLAALATTLTAEVLLSEDEQRQLSETISELQQMAIDIEETID